MGVSESTFAAETVGVSTVGAADAGVTVAADAGAVIVPEAAGVPTGLVPLADEFKKLPPERSPQIIERVHTSYNEEHQPGLP